MRWDEVFARLENKNISVVITRGDGSDQVKSNEHHANLTTSDVSPDNMKMCSDTKHVIGEWVPIGPNIVSQMNKSFVCCGWDEISF